MFLTRWQDLFRRRGPVSVPSANAIRPHLEVLEERAAPTSASGPAFTYTTITNTTEAFGLNNQLETVSVQVTSPGGNVSQGQVTITDGRQTQTVNVNSTGQATATFNFPFAQEQPRSHPVTASYADNNSPSLFASSSVTSNVITDPNAYADGYVAQIVFDLYIVSLFTGGSGTGSGGGQNAGQNQS
jgi:hypothetical protein